MYALRGQTINLLWWFLNSWPSMFNQATLWKIGGRSVSTNGICPDCKQKVRTEAGLV
jgi:hypothetical protein